MLFRKAITICKIIKYSLCKIKIRMSIHSNIEFFSKVYNNGKKLKIGRAYIRTNTLINTEENGFLTIGDNFFINRNSIISCRNMINIGDNCCIGPNVCIYDHNHLYDCNGVKAGYSLGEVIIGNNVWIGAGVIILSGTHIGDNCIVAAGTIVKGTFPDNCMISNEKVTKTKSLREMKF